MSPTSPIISFYSPSSKSTDSEGRTLDDILTFSDRQLEYYHDYIQHLFPLPERSPVNPDAPLITADVREAFLSDAELRSQLRRALARMGRFYGFDVSFEEDESGHSKGVNVQRGENFERASKQTWLKRMDHNHLRITRIIRCLRILGLEDEAKAFHQALLDNDDDGRVGDRTKMFWRRAAERPLHLPPEENDEHAEGVKWLRDGR